MASPSEPTKLQQAIAAHSNGLLVDADALYREWLSANPTDALALHNAGIVALQLNQPEEALRLLSFAVRADPKNAMVMLHMGDALSILNRHAEAAGCYQDGIAERPGDPVFHIHLGNALRAQGKSAAAETAYRTALQLSPGLELALVNLGHVLSDQRRHKDAISFFEEALAGGGNSLELWIGLSQACLESGDLGKTESLLKSALSQYPDDQLLLTLLGECYRRGRAYGDAEALFKRALSKGEAPLITWHNFAKLLLESSRFVEAETVFRNILKAAPNVPEIVQGLAASLVAQRRRKEAEATLHTLVSRLPGHAPAWYALGQLLLVKSPNEALVCARRAFELRPNAPESHEALAHALNFLGRIDEAVASQESAASETSHRPSHLSGLVHLLAYTEARPPQEILRRARLWSDSLPRPAHPFAEVRSLERRPLRVGYLSPDLGEHSVAPFFEPLLAHHDLNTTEVSIYSSISTPDAATARLQSKVPESRWHRIHTMSDEAAAKLIRSHEIDILVDLAGHTRDHRLGIMAFRPAPIQATYIGYFGTTGLAEMDYFIGDEIILPQGIDAGYSERLWRLPRCWLSYQAPTGAPPLGFSGQNRAFTFGSFNSVLKLSSKTLRLWAAVLRAVPDSRLLIKTKTLEDELQRKRFLEEFTSQGVSADRIELRTLAPDRTKHLAQYNEVDIALDTTPINGRTTTVEALWMGVPVLTRAGDTAPSRMSASMLTSMGLPGWIAYSDDEYIALASTYAAELSGHPPAVRKAHRESIRKQMESSALCDGVGLARALDKAYADMARLASAPR